MDLDRQSWQDTTRVLSCIARQLASYTEPDNTQFGDGEQYVDSRQENSFGPLPVFENVTPDDLAQVVSKYRAWAKGSPAYTNWPHPSCDFAVISDKGIEDLVRNCYLASLQPEEGRYPRFLVVVGGRRRPPELVTQFMPPIPLASPNLLRKLAPAIASDFAVSVREEATGLHCEGIAANLWEKNFLFASPGNRRTTSDMPLLKWSVY